MSRAKQWDRSAEFLTAWQMAKALNLCEESIYRAYRKGNLEAVRIGRSLRFPTGQIARGGRGKKARGEPAAAVARER